MKKLRLLATLFVLPWLVVATIGTRYVMAAPAEQAGAQTFTALVGNGISTKTGEKPSWQGQNFYPASITLNVGDSIQWKFNSGNEPHTLTFMGPVTSTGELFVPDPAYSPPVSGPPKILFNPEVVNPAGGTSYDGSAFTNSGVRAADVPAPMDYTLTFTKAGTYDYVCLLHSATLPNGAKVGMVGKVIVQDAGSTRPMTPEQVMAEGQKQIDSDIQRAKDLEPMMTAMAKPSETMADGSTMHHVTVGNMDMERNLEFERFTPRDVNIKVGDTVEFSLGMAPAFHTVTLGDEPELLMFEPQPEGAPKVVVNNAVLLPAGGPVHTGTGYYNSGPLAGPMDPPERGIKSYTLKFTQAGRYEYICVPHYSLGMVGTIIVAAADSAGSPTPGTTIGMPQTGSTDPGWLIYGLVALAVVLGGVVVTIITRTRKSA
jgi:plastocyanin